MIAMIYFINVFEDNHIFLSGVHIVTSQKMLNETLANKNLFSENNTYMKKYLANISNHND